MNRLQIKTHQKNRKTIAVMAGVAFATGAIWLNAGIWETCTDIENHSCNACNDSCSPVTLSAACMANFGWSGTFTLSACEGFVADYNNNGCLSCMMTNYVLGAAGQGNNCTDVFVPLTNPTYVTVTIYHYYNGNGNTCPPCIREYQPLSQWIGGSSRKTFQLNPIPTNIQDNYTCRPWCQT